MQQKRKTEITLHLLHINMFCSRFTALSLLDTSKALGDDDVSPIILKHCMLLQLSCNPYTTSSPFVCLSLTQQLNGTLTVLLLFLNVAISLVSQIGCSLSKVLYIKKSSLTRSVVFKSSISPVQFGFVKNCSTSQQLLLHTELLYSFFIRQSSTN